jgi:glycosyltransferase involved in cell wall biosynthesis
VTDKFNTILVLDTQPIDPPVGGGRLRLIGLYHNLGSVLSTHYIGTYDWPGEKFRDHYLSNTLREVDIPLSNEHFVESRKWQERVGGKTIIDSLFPKLAHKSPQFVDYVRNEVSKASVVIFSHPWVYPLVKDLLDKRTQTVIYDSHNVEGYLKYTLLNDGSYGTEIVREVVQLEAELCHFADIILACSQDDIEMFSKFYNVPVTKMRVVPNGVFTEKIKPVNNEEKKKSKKQLVLEENMISIFIGSNYAPNIEACEFIIKELAQNFQEMTFIIAGGVGEGVNKQALIGINNVRITGFLTEQEKLLYLTASDIAINPMMSGSGTNIKMFDYMAAGLPIITTDIGSRGITETDYAGIILRDRGRFLSSLRELMGNLHKVQHLGKANRDLVEQNYSWEKISPKLGALLVQNITKKNVRLVTSTPVGLKKNKFALMSSWNIHCGIAEHSRYLANSLELYDVNLSIIANSNSDRLNSYLIDDITKNVFPLWKYDYLTWRDSEIDKDGIIRILRQEGISKLNIQYHYGFFNQQVLMNFARQCIKAGIEVSITLHNSKEMDFETFIEMSKLNIKIIVHASEDKKRLTDKGIRNVHHVPLGILDFPDEDINSCRKSLGISGNPLIGSFGFLRQHKGVLETIEAIAILRNKYPNIQLLGLNALYTSHDSYQYLQKCNERIDELKLDKNIILITDFLYINQIIKYLHAVDIIVLPYHDSKEGSSAAANTAIASKRPLMISKSGIFSEIKNIGYEIKDITPVDIASEIDHVFSNPELIRQMKAKVTKYVEENSYSKIANKYIELIT